MFKKLRQRIKTKAEETAAKIGIHKVIKYTGMKNYRTFLAGLAMAAFVACLPVIQKGDFNIKRDWPYLVGAALSAIGGYVQKDAMVTGLPDDSTTKP